MKNEELVEKLTKIIEDSDDRMRHTNEMVNKLSETLELITKEYANHLDSLKACRDNLTDMIKHQQILIEQMRIDINNERARNKELVDKFILRASVNVTQQ